MNLPTPSKRLDFCGESFILIGVSKDLPILIEPSLLSGDFGKLADEAKRVEDAGADALHIDIMDGHFVPNLTLGPKAVSAVNRVTDLFLDVHIMIYNPFDYIERLVEAGADRITFHIEATEDVEETLSYIRKCNVEAGLAFCPETTHEMIPKYLDKCDLILLMTVHPGFGGQAFMPEMLQKIQYTREAIDKLKIRKGGVIPKKNSITLTNGNSYLTISDFPPYVTGPFGITPAELEAGYIVILEPTATINGFARKQHASS